ncbi:MAG TPA: hypothetical protein VHM26_05240 [Chitinophagaceae bacterium]|jgi:hypothetical protein|nr:hypothetical protein [Chitinophagaceae bacterium]
MSKHEELKKAVQFVRQSMTSAKMILDLSVDSVKHLDYTMDTEFTNKGKLRNPQGNFAKFQPIIMIGFSGYIADVIMKHTSNARLEIDDAAQYWYLDFKVVAENGWIVKPGQRLTKRAHHGEQAELYRYTIAAINYFRQPASEMTQPFVLEEVLVKKKPWWKFGK